jgi:hypothetical protein
MESKRYIPEIVNFLHQLVVKILKAKTPSSLFMLRKISKNLGIDDFTAPVTDLTFTTVFDGDLKINDSTRLGMLKEAIALLIKFCRLWNDVTSVLEVFEITMPLLDKIPSTSNADILVSFTLLTLAIPYRGKESNQSNSQRPGTETSTSSTPTSKGNGHQDLCS